MIRSISLFFLAILTIAAAPAGEDVLSVSPAKPQRGDVLTVMYHPSADGAVLKNPDALNLLAMVVDEDNTLSLIESAMQNDGSVWKGEVKPGTANPVLVLFKVMAKDKTDDNEGSFWDVQIHKPNGTPIRSAHAMRAASFAFGGYPGFRRVKDPAASKAELEKEMKLYPDNWRGTITSWNMIMAGGISQTGIERIRKELTPFAGQHKDNDEAYGAAIAFFEQTGDSAKGKEIRAEIMKRNPSGQLARRWRIADASREKDPARKAEALEGILRDFPKMEPDELGGVIARLVPALLQLEKFDRIGEIFAARPRVGGGVYNQAAWSLIEKGERLDLGVEWAKLGVEASRHPDPALKPSTMRKADWEENNAYTLGMVLDTYGYGLMKQGNGEAAVTALEEAYALSKGEDGELNEHYVSALVAANMHEKALTVGVECITKGNSTEAIQSAMQSAFAKRENAGTYDGLPMEKKEQFNRIIADAREAMKEEIRKRLRESRIKEPAVDFSLSRLEGEPVTLSALKGKVVVIDFWATWCGPCRASFPYLQKVYEKFKENPDVMILAVNTWERMNEKQAIIDNAKKFMSDNKYTFPVLFDDHAVSDYDVEGIPTKFIIDRTGNIAFKEIGFNGAKMEDELSMQIEMLLAEATGSR